MISGLSTILCYFITTVSENTVDVVKNYIKNQEIK